MGVCTFGFTFAVRAAFQKASRKPQIYCVSLNNVQLLRNGCTETHLRGLGPKFAKISCAFITASSRERYTCRKLPSPAHSHAVHLGHSRHSDTPDTASSSSHRTGTVIGTPPPPHLRRPPQQARGAQGATAVTRPLPSSTPGTQPAQ